MSSLKNVSKFFGAKPTTKFIVCGASNNANKFGYKVLNWYIRRQLPVVPINPSSAEVLGIPAYISLLQYLESQPSYSSKDETFSISVITAPTVTEQLADEFIQLQQRVNCIWFQPGSYNNTIIDKLEKNGFKDKLIFQGACILVSGDQGLNEYYGKDSRL